jgi:hypothetical protein
VQLTKESAKLVDRYGLRQSSKSQLSTGVLKGSKGQIKGFVEFSKTPGQMLRNPAMLTGAAGIMAQLAMQQTMEEITDYLARIDAKVDDVLRAQKDAVIADMLGVDLVIDEAMTIRAEVGRVSDITWSKAQNSSMVIAKTQAYALRQLDALAEKLERETKVSELAKLTRDAEVGVRDWLAVLAHCFRLADGISVLELERVLDADPEDLDQHRIGVQTARRNRMALIARTTEQLLTRMDAAARTANAKVLLNPGQPRTSSATATRSQTALPTSTASSASTEVTTTSQLGAGSMPQATYATGHSSAAPTRATPCVNAGRKASTRRSGSGPKPPTTPSVRRTSSLTVFQSDPSLDLAARTTEPLWR